jgi:hypothetical protein
MAACRPRAARWLKPALILVFGLAALIASAQPNDNFTNDFVLSGTTGTTNGDNVTATLEGCEANAVICQDDGLQPVANSVWFKWTAPGNGPVSFDTIGSGFDTVLSIWTTTNGLCGSSLTNIVSDDQSGLIVYGDAFDTSYVTFDATAGTTYYIAVYSWDGAGPNSGNYVLNWTAGTVAVPTLPTGVFKFTQPLYTVSETDSVGPNSTTVNPSVLGARVTVTRPVQAYGRVTVDYLVTNLLYTNTFTTNFYGTNVLITFIDTNGVMSQTNTYSTNVFIINSYQYYNNGYHFITTTNGYTNGASLNLYAIFATNFPGTFSAMSSTDIPTNLPITTNYTLSSSGATFSFITNVFGFLVPGRTVTGITRTNGTIAMDGSGTLYTNFINFFTNTITTNYYGTNIFLSYTAGGRLLSTN